MDLWENTEHGERIVHINEKSHLTGHHNQIQIEPGEIPMIRPEFPSNSTLASTTGEGDMQRFSSDKNLKCSQCKKCLTPVVDHLRDQQHRLIWMDKIPQCQQCNKLFSTGHALKGHIDRIHNKLKPCICETCHKGFATTSALKIHSVTHTKAKNYKCATCNKGFSQASALKTHTMIHTGEKPYSCKVCGITFRLKVNMRLHEITHSADKTYKCDLCGKAFKTKPGLNQHLRMFHRLGKPHNCHICSKAFYSHANLNIHLRSHTGEKPYVCQYCRHVYSQKSTLQAHIKLHHKDMAAPQKEESFMVEDAPESKFQPPQFGKGFVHPLHSSFLEPEIRLLEVTPDQKGV